ncbi:MAG: MBL fold metallo-hydrolase [Endomicrobium sp.]|jgi:glyoxylase-like metal-dependent hydrolase (beta-lactamase superfamily II)|nr:MBL fold metallo-hydrolase [Endomicrobium sp.]
MDRYKICGLEISRFVFAPVKSNMYLILVDKEALIIDPHVSTEAYNFLKKYGVEKVTVIFTHEHPDHTFGIKPLKRLFPVVIICQKNCAESIADISNNRPILISFILSKQDRMNGTNNLEVFNKVFEPFFCKTDISFDQELYHEWHKYKLYLKATPGHSRGSCCIILYDKIFLLEIHLFSILLLLHVSLAVV